MDGSLTPTELGLYGYNSDGEEVHVGSPSAQHPAVGARDRLRAVGGSIRLSATRTRSSFAACGEEFVPVQLPSTNRQKAYRPRAYTDPLPCVPENEDLASHPAASGSQASCDWDNFAENTSFSAAGQKSGSRCGSQDTLYSSKNVSNPRSQLSSGDEDDFLSPMRSDDSASHSETEEPEMDSAAWRRKVELAILEADEDILPFRGKKTTFDCLTKLCVLASSVKKQLQVAHVELREDATYKEAAEVRSATCRASLTEFMVDSENVRAQLEEEAAARRAANGTSAAAAVAEAVAAKRPIIAHRAKDAEKELHSVITAFQQLVQIAPVSDEQLFEKVEKCKAVEEQHAATSLQCKEVSGQAMDCHLMEASDSLERLLAAARQEKLNTTNQLLEWRKEAGVWSEKNRRPVRGDLKAPTYTAGLSGKVTVYEFERDWKEYVKAMEFSKEEAMKALKQAVQPPARGDVFNLQSTAEIFDYLKKHHGNPMMLLHAKEQDVKSWSSCKGADLAQREWLVQAKTKLAAILTMCKEHGIEKYLHFSTIAGEIQSKFPAELTKDFKILLKKHLSPSGVLEKEIIIGLLMEFIEDKITDCTLGVNLDIVNYLGTSREEKPATSGDSQKSNSNNRQRNWQQRSIHAANQSSSGTSNRNQASGGGHDGRDSGGGGAFKIDDKCLSCGGNHTHLFYCETFINATVSDRFSLVKKQQACGRCLSMKVKLTGPRREWQQRHDKYCRTRFACEEGDCKGRSTCAQFHITLCRHHFTENKNVEDDFIKSLDTAKLPSNCQSGSIRFLHMGAWLARVSNTAPSAATVQVLHGGQSYDVLPDVYDAAAFMMQSVPASKDDKQLLVFYDTGCGGAGISNRAFGLLTSRPVRDGPTVLDVAGGKCIEIPYGDEQFTLQLDGGHRLATITALHMPVITSIFPAIQLQQAWNDLATAASGKCQLPLPSADDTIGGSAVDLILGVRYLKYFPTLVFSLPSGLSVYRAKFRSYSGNQAVLGGPHAAWQGAAAAAEHMNPRAYFTSEARAWCVQESWARINQGKFGEQQEQDIWCCDEQESQIYKMANCRIEEKDFLKAEAVGGDAPYRCISCRNCQRCKRSEDIEEISFKEEAEQALIETSVVLDERNNRLVASLPFVENPTTHLKPNRFVAECVFRSQLALFKKKPDMRADTLKSHEKLVQRGYVKREDELTSEERVALETIPSSGYYIPWRIVHNEGSISTPCRMVFDASSKTPGGESLNGILAKGQNKLVKIQSLLAKFRLNKAAVTADISMAYNGTWLQPEFYKFQRYLWKKDLLEEEPTTVMYVLTLIYGVKPSGGQCQVAIEKLADFFTARGQHVEAALVLKEDVYVDDVISGQDCVEDCYSVATGIETILAKGSMAVKAFTFSGQAPEAAVSADGVHVGLAGYLWRPEEDVILLDIGPPRLGKARRGKMPEPVAGDFGQALSRCFTRRTLTGLVARVFDPLGLATPLTANLKLDLHDLCTRKLDWDDEVPKELLDMWVANMATIQDLKLISFKRAVIPEDAANTKLSLIVLSDASQSLAATAIYGRVRRRCGQYSCQLILARSKIVANFTIPRAEMKAAVLGAVTSQVVKKNLGDRLGDVLYVTDSTICLHWIHQDDRPLQVAVRNAVIEVRRFSEVDEWVHVESHLNVADMATRPAVTADIGTGSAWQEGQEWMRLPRADMPVRTAAEVVLSAEEKRVAATEMRSRDVRGHSIHVNVDKMAARYAASSYLLDPCHRPWPSVVRVVALVLRFLRVVRARVARRRSLLDPGELKIEEQRPPVQLTFLPEEITDAEMYFFRLGSKEVTQFCKPGDYKHCSVLRDGVLFFTGRVLDGQDILSFEVVMFDLNPLSFCKPILDRFSPIAYSIMIHTHWSDANHLNAAHTFRESLSTAYTLGGRELAQEIRNSCVFCRRFKARLVQVEMGKIHQSRLVIAPPFTICQVDLFGPYKAQCEHNHRATVKVWGAVFKDPASGAVFAHAMSKCDTSAFILAYNRFSARFCHPQKLYPDSGSQLLQACREIELSWIDVAYTLNAQHGVGVEFSPCPVGGHNVHGAVERSIQEIKKLFDTVYHGVKLDVLGFETAFAWISNELNNMPICIGMRYRDLDHLDLLTPNRLIHGRANKRALSGCCVYGTPSAMLAKMEDVFQAWWRAWYEEKIADFVAKPSKWLRSDQQVKQGDIVLFLKTGDEQILGEPIWRVGRVTEVELSDRDLQARVVIIEYKNSRESVFRTTRRSVRKVAVLHREDEVELVQQINAAARAAEKIVGEKSLYLEQQKAVFSDVKRCGDCQVPYLCEKHSLYFWNKPFFQAVVCASQSEERLEESRDCCSEVCQQLKIHTDSWE